MTADQARDEILAVFKAAWDTTGYGAVYQDVTGKPPSEEEPWARVILRHADGGQTGFGSTNEKKFTDSGLLVVQVFTPLGDGLTKSYELARIVQLAFSKAHGSVWYRNQRINEVGKDGSYQQTNVLINFSYSDQR